MALETISKFTVHGLAKLFLCLNKPIIVGVHGFYGSLRGLRLCQRFVRNRVECFLRYLKKRMMVHTISSQLETMPKGQETLASS